MRLTCAVAAVILFAVSVFAIPPLPPNTTNCGYRPTWDEPCGPQCAQNISGVCSDACGKPCTNDTDCGAYPWAPCSVCVNGQCVGNAEFGNCTLTDPPPNVSNPRIAPVLPTYWNASFSMANYTDPEAPPVTGYTWYDYTVGGLRQDFTDGPCPFTELQSGVAPGNNATCSVLFYKNVNYYVYGAGTEDAVCCGYNFPGWAPDSYQVGNASFGGNSTYIDGIQTDHWRFQYTCPWITPQPKGPWPQWLPKLTVQRDVYTIANGNTPLAMNETLTSGFSTFKNVQVGPQDVNTVFEEFLGALNCINEATGNATQFFQVCNKYNAAGRLGYLGFG